MSNLAYNVFKIKEIEMVACAKFLGREISSCSRGKKNCVCSSKKDEIQFAIGAINWSDFSTYEISENVEKLIIRFVNKETQECADLCKELYINDGITCSEEIELRLI